MSYRPWTLSKCFNLSCLLGYDGELVPDAQDRGKGDKQHGYNCLQEHRLSHGEVIYPEGRPQVSTVPYSRCVSQRRRVSQKALYCGLISLGVTGAVTFSEGPPAFTTQAWVLCNTQRTHSFCDLFISQIQWGFICYYVSLINQIPQLFADLNKSHPEFLQLNQKNCAHPPPRLLC